MASFGIELYYTRQSREFIKKTNKRLEEGRLIINPFIGKIKPYNRFCAISIRPVYASPFGVGAGLSFIILMIVGFTYWLIPPLMIMLAGVFWTPHFFYIFFKMGLRKEGYKGKVKMLMPGEVLRRIIENGAT